MYRAATGQMTTGTISHADSLRGWFVMMKDSTGRYAANKPIWGDRWGWSWFDAGNGRVAGLPTELQSVSSAGGGDGLDLR